MNQPKSLTQQTFSGTLYLMSSGGVQVVLKIGVLAVLARLILPADFGLMGIALVVIEFSKLFSQMGVGPCIVQRRNLDDKLLSSAFSLSLLVGLLFSGLLVLTAPVIEFFFRMTGLTTVLRYVSIVFLVNAITVTAQALLQRAMKFRVIAGIEVVSYAAGYGIAGIALAYMGYGIWALVAANLAQAVLAAALYLIAQPFPKKLSLHLPSCRELLYFGFGFTLSKICNFLAIQGDNLVVGRTLGAVALGIYGRAYNFMVMPSSLFGNALDRSLFPAMARVQDNRSQLARAYLSGTGLIALIALPVSILMVLLAPEIIMVLLGPAWMAAVDPFRILACSLLFRMSYKMSDSLARATGAVYRRAWRQLVYATLVFIGAYIGHFWGLPGVAAAVAVALITNFLLMGQLAIQLTGISWQSLFKVHANGVVLAATTGIVCWLALSLCREFQLLPVFTLLLTIAAPCLLTAMLFRYQPQLLIRADQLKLMDKLVLKRFKKPLPQAA